MLRPPMCTFVMFDSGQPGGAGTKGFPGLPGDEGFPGLGGEPGPNGYMGEVGAGGLPGLPGIFRFYSFLFPFTELTVTVSNCSK